MTTANERAPIVIDITWVVRAIEREHELQRITPGQPLKVSYSKFLGYCPQNVINAVNCAGHPDFYAISICLELAEEHKLIVVERASGKYSYKTRRSAYRLPLSHPMVKKVTRVTNTGRLVKLV